MLPSAIDLIYFQEVATVLHFSRAANQLNVSQPALSLGIKRLENTLGTALFIRHNQGVSLTRAGVALLKNVKNLLAAWDATRTEINEVLQTVKGPVSIGCHSTLAPFMSKMVADLLKQYPALEIHFKHELTPLIMEDIIHGHLDIGITTDPQPHPNVILQPIAETEFTFYKAIKNQVDADLLTADSVIICDPQLPQTQYLLKELRKDKKTERFRLTMMNQIESIAAMTAESSGIGILPTQFTQHYFSDKLMKVHNAPVYSKPLCLTYRAENKKVIAIQIVLKGIKELAQQAKSPRPCASLGT